MGDDKISPSGFLTVAYFYHLGCASLCPLTSFYMTCIRACWSFLLFFCASFLLLVYLRLPPCSRPFLLVS